MQIIVGLGNPGEQYQGSRHNVGMMLVELLSTQLASDYGWRKNYNAMVFKSPQVTLVKTRDVFMNESGRLLQGLPEGDLYVAHDDLDLRLGEYKIQKAVGPKLHYGVQSLEKTFGSKDFWRIRIGVDNRDTENRTPGEAYVLQRFSTSEREVINSVLEKIGHEIHKPNSG
ncbi:MAG: aminoacyl-tRNA hydrolase [bacterium]|nr:aminoacyl-tRNA hydrolase [bacterium]